MNEMGHLAPRSGALRRSRSGASADTPRARSPRPARNLGCTCVMIGTSQRSALYHMLRGNVLHGLARMLPEYFKIITVG